MGWLPAQGGHFCSVCVTPGQSLTSLNLDCFTAEGHPFTGCHAELCIKHAALCLACGEPPQAIWENQFYYLFGFLFLVFIILVVSCSQISIVMVYFQLCAEDYRWWWRNFLVSGGSAFYVLVYAIFYFVNKLDIVEFIPSLLYFGYTALMVLSFWLLTGTIGFYAAYMFVRKIYAAVKID
uniref:Transmembrane 9 superfamily member n=1 Tax=Capra hircus TaxID=9925 RepID=A0A8C2NU41_CAPHI